MFWVRLFVTGRLPAVFGWFWIAVLPLLIGVVQFVLRQRHQVATTWLGSLTGKRSRGRVPSLRSAKASAPGWAGGAEGWLLRTVVGH